MSPSMKAIIRDLKMEIMGRLLIEGMPSEKAYRRPQTDVENLVFDQLKIKDPLVRVTSESISFVSGNCIFCEDPWKHELEIETRDSVTLEPTGKRVTVRLCESCLKERSPLWEGRYEITHTRETT